MPEIDFGPDLEQILMDEGTLDCTPEGTLQQQLIVARDAVRNAYRMAYKAVDGDVEDRVVNALDMIENLIRDVIAHSA
ncbi:hypothetical protein PL81_31060 [Streptomyces sp. RSD-27]|nr:hypothetical protein PL81_31060 [Streptomyces sp. RSD-27]